MLSVEVVVCSPVLLVSMRVARAPLAGLGEKSIGDVWLRGAALVRLEHEVVPEAI